MNLKKYIQSEIKSQLSESGTFDLTESLQGELDIMAQEAKDLKSFVKSVYKEFDNLPKNRDSLNWLTDIYKESTNESIVKEGAMSELDAMAQEAKDLKSFVKDAYKEFKTLDRNKSSLEWLTDIFNQATNESVTEGLFKNITKGTKNSKGPWVIVVIQNGKVINQEYTNIPDVIPAIYRETVKKYPKAHVTIEASTGETVYSKGKNESTVNEEQLEEKLITFSNRANYGQIVFMAGGAGSGKGFAISNFIDSSSFKVRDVDEMKKAVGNLDKLGKLSIEQWYKKFSKNLKEDELAHVDKYVKDKKLTLKALSNNLRDPNNVSALHYIVDAMGLKDNWVTNMLMGKENKEVLPNLIFDITAKKVSSITDVLKPLIDAGYKPASIHLIWVLTNYHMAVDNNAGRSRVVPADTLLTTHEGASTTLWSMLTGILPNGINGRIDVILNNKQNTVFYNKMGKENTKATKSGGIDQRSNTSRTQTVVKQKRDDDGKLKTTRKLEKVKFVANFLSLPIKKQGGGVISEKIWKDILFKWIVDNAPASTELVQDAKS